ncbi:STARD3 N-terminal-like protein isoform X3 [Orcinus orca]|uniref:STARD3 N-terminal-like protein isoform X3 n=1 Tax=Orcinus orca TaxID=9733 RepID=UPI001442546C|nr:STARD3 N-terminal-like protein isoform X3 [Orcinus orca]
MNPVPEDMENALMGSQSSHASLRDVHSINPTQLMARIESYEGREKKGISDVRRTFCLFVTFDLLFVTLLWIIELNVNGGIENTLEKEVVQYDYYSSYFDIFLLAVFRFKVLILAYAVCRLRHWWAIAVSTPVDDSSDQCLFTSKSDPLKAFLSRGFRLRAAHHFLHPCLDRDVVPGFQGVTSRGRRRKPTPNSSGCLGEGSTDTWWSF